MQDILTDEDRAALKAALIAERAGGNDNPLIASDVDLDGDGVCDAFGLDANDEVIVVSGCSIGDTTYASSGDDIGAL